MAVGYLDVGMKPMQSRIQERICLFVWRACRSSDPILSKVFHAVRNDPLDAWNKQVMEFIEDIGPLALEGPKRALKKALQDSAVAKVLGMKCDMSFLVGMPQPRQWFRLPNHINSSVAMQALNLCRAGDAGLGNRRPNEHGHQFKACPLCSKRDVNHKLNEEHVVTVCPAVSFERDSLGISAYLNASRTCPPSNTRLYKNYLGGTMSQWMR